MPNTQPLKGLTVPLIYRGGEIQDGTGKTILKAEREAGKTPIGPAGRDALLKLTCELLNEAFEHDKASQILRNLGY